MLAPVPCRSFQLPCPPKALKAMELITLSSWTDYTVDFSSAYYQFCFPLSDTFCVLSHCCFSYCQLSAVCSLMVSLLVFLSFRTFSPSSFGSAHRVKKGPISRKTNLYFSVLHEALLNTNHKLIST